jgi:O-glycosyl hydrolase
MKQAAKLLIFVISALAGRGFVCAQSLDFTAVSAEVDFSRKLRDWDGFGVNYVEVSQSLDYATDPQEYGGFSLLSDSEKAEILDMIFGNEGLKPGIVKMFLDPFHQKEPGGAFDHETTTRFMRLFVREGLKRTRARGDNLVVFTTLYGPPAWATRQGFLRGRDLNPERKRDLANYMIDWVKFLREKEAFPVRYVSLHNEGEDWHRWPADGKSGNIGKGNDYNMFWPPEQVVDFLRFMPAMLKEQGLPDVGVSPGECTNWYRFSAWGYADAIADDEVALRNLGLITSHGFYGGTYGRWFGEHRSVGTDILRAKRPELHAWVTSTSWSKMDADNLKEMHGNIYTAKVNGITPWACIQRPAKWVGGDPNPGTAFRVQENGSYEVMRGFYYYKQVSRAGQTGMAVARTSAMDSEVALIGFAKNATRHPDAFVLVNVGKQDKLVAVRVRGSESTRFEAFRTTDEKDRYAGIGGFALKDGLLIYTAPARSATTFFGRPPR